MLAHTSSGFAESDLFTVDAVGVRIGIDTSALSTSEREAVHLAWRSARTKTFGPPDAVVAPASLQEPEEMLAALSGQVTRAAIKAPARDRWMLHAAGVADADGNVVALVGRSGAGKTTAVRSLARRWGYVSDETVGIEPDGTVLAYRKPLSTITDGFGFKVQRAPEGLGLQPLPSQTLRLRRLILLERRTERCDARLAPVTTQDALAALVGHSSGLINLARPLRTVISAIEKTGGVLRAEYSAASDLVHLIETLAPPRESVRLEYPLRDVPDRPRMRAAMTTPGTERSANVDRLIPRYRRGPVVDWHALDGQRIAVLPAGTDGDGRLHLLAGVAPTVWLAADDATLNELVAAVSMRHDCHNPEETTSAALFALQEAALVSRTP